MPSTVIYKLTSEGEYPLGRVLADGTIVRGVMGQGEVLGRLNQGVVYRRTAHDERELGAVDSEGRVHSHGLFEGGALGWTDPDGVVVRAGLIFGEEEVGRIEGPDLHAGGAALLLLFLPEDEESSRWASRN